MCKRNTKITESLIVCYVIRSRRQILLLGQEVCQTRSERWDNAGKFGRTEIIIEVSTKQLYSQLHSDGRYVFSECGLLNKYPFSDYL